MLFAYCVQLKKLLYQGRISLISRANNAVDNKRNKTFSFHPDTVLVNNVIELV